MGSISQAPDIDLVLSRLSLEDKISLLAATDWWRTPTIDRDDVFVPPIKTTDGPNGARGESYVSGIKAACFPCGTSLGASFDVELLCRVGQEIAREARTKSANVLLAPTLNVIRSPLGGRNYETFSEDPLVLGKLASAFIDGCQSQGIAATPKHFVANEAENQRTTLSVEVDEQTLREIYLLPFQILLKQSDPWCLMTSYNKVNGTYVADDVRLVDKILRKEWRFKGLVVSDWMGVYSTVDSINAGVDLEMPGPTKFRGQHLIAAVQSGQVSQKVIDTCVKRVLRLATITGQFDDPTESPEIALQDKQRDNFIVEAGAEGMVLLKNEGLLPIMKTSSVAIIGHHAMNASLGGGGSARVDALHAISPLEGMQQAGYNVSLAPGVPVFGALPHADPKVIWETSSGRSKTPVRTEWFNGDKIGENLVCCEMKPNAEYMIKEQWPSYLARNYCTRMTFDIEPRTTGQHILSIISTGRAVCRIDGQIIYEREQERNLKPESFYFFKSKLERRFTHSMTAGQRYTLVLESWATPEALLQAAPLNGRMFQGSALRFHEEINVPRRLATAAEVARQCDVAVICVGTTNEIESEGFDRDNMQLSSQQYELIQSVVAVNPRTCVVNFSGGPVDLTPFHKDVAAIVQAWFPGQECGHSLAKVLSGDTNPSGRLPFSWPARVEDSSSHGNFPAQNNLLCYEEGLNVGYRWHDRPEAPEPLFPFGHGLSYTTFKINKAMCTPKMSQGVVDVTFEVENTGDVAGKLAVQIYVQGPPNAPGLPRPLKELKDFSKLHLAPRQRIGQTVQLDKYAVSIYDPIGGRWLARQGCYQVFVGVSSRELQAQCTFEVLQEFWWTGL